MIETTLRYEVIHRHDDEVVKAADLVVRDSGGKAFRRISRGAGIVFKVSQRLSRMKRVR
jgi:hypothetical protein